MSKRKDIYLDGLRLKKTRIKYYVGVSGTKYPYFHRSYDLNPDAEKRYSNIGDEHWSHIGCWDLPKEDYPYSFEYENWEDKVPVWMRDYLENEYKPKMELK